MNLPPLKVSSMRSHRTPQTTDENGMICEIVYDYSPLRDYMKSIGMSFRCLCRTFGYCTNVSADINANRPISLETVGRLAHDLSLPIEGILKIGFRIRKLAEVEAEIANKRSSNQKRIRYSNLKTRITRKDITKPTKPTK